MADDETSTPGTTSELDRLVRQQAVADARAKLAAVGTSALGSLAPGVTDGPKGEVTLGTKAGSLAPWLTQHVLADAATQIAAAVRALEPNHAKAWRVLVTSDATLLQTDVRAGLTRAALTARARQLEPLPQVVRDALARLDAAPSPAATEAPGGRFAGATPESPGTTVETPAADDEAAAEAETTAATAGPLDAAVQLVRLAAVDFTVTAAEVSADASLLAALTAGALPTLPTDKGGEIQVHLDGFDVSRTDRPTFRALTALATAADMLSAEVLRLRARLAPLAAELAERRTAAATAQTDWVKAVTDKDATGATELKARLDQLTAEVSALQAAVAPAQKVLDHAEAAVETARTDVAAAMTADASGVSPVARACAREALHLDGAQEGDRITHVLYVRPTHAGADVVTRRSVLGSSGRVTYLGSASTAWTLLRVADGRTLGGGAPASARQYVHDLTTATTSALSIDNGGSPGDDPLAENEKKLRTAVLALAFGVALLGVAAAVGVALGPLLAALT